MKNYCYLRKTAKYIGTTLNGVIKYYFDENLREIGYHPNDIPELTMIISRKWSQDCLNSLDFTKINH